MAELCSGCLSPRRLWEGLRKVAQHDGFEVGGGVPGARPGFRRRPTASCPLPVFFFPLSLSRYIGVNAWGRFRWPQPHNVP